MNLGMNVVGQDGVIALDTATRLAQVRRAIEEGCGGPIHCLQINAAALLDDVARALGLGDGEIQRVIGDEGYATVCRSGNGTGEVYEHGEATRYAHLCDS